LVSAAARTRCVQGLTNELPDKARLQAAKQQVRSLDDITDGGRAIVVFLTGRLTELRPRAVIAALRHTLAVDAPQNIQKYVFQNGRADLWLIQQAHEYFERPKLKRRFLVFACIATEASLNSLDQERLRMLLEVVHIHVAVLSLQAASFGCGRRRAGSDVDGHTVSVGANEPRVETTIERHVSTKDDVDRGRENRHRVGLRQMTAVDWKHVQQQVQRAALNEDIVVLQRGTQRVNLRTHTRSRAN